MKYFNETGTSYFIDSLKDMITTSSEYTGTSTYNNWTTDKFENGSYIAHQVANYTQTPTLLSLSNFLNIYYYFDITLPTYTTLTGTLGIPTICEASIITTTGWGWLVPMANASDTGSANAENPLKSYRFICFASSSITLSVYWELVKYSEVSWEDPL